jgi:hypothetical protein
MREEINDRSDTVTTVNDPVVTQSFLKAELDKFATKEDLAEAVAKVATKEDLARLPTHEDVARIINAAMEQQRAWFGVLDDKHAARTDAVREDLDAHRADRSVHRATRRR